MAISHKKLCWPFAARCALGDMIQNARVVEEEMDHCCDLRSIQPPQTEETWLKYLASSRTVFREWNAAPTCCFRP